MLDSVNLYKYFVFSPKYLAYILFNHLLIQICNYHDIHQLRFAFAFRMHYFSFSFFVAFFCGSLNTLALTHTYTRTQRRRFSATFHVCFVLTCRFLCAISSTYFKFQ